MLTVREKMAMGIFDFLESQNETTTHISKPTNSIPRNSPFLGTITEDGYCDFEVPEDKTYLGKDVTRAIRMDKSERARKHRREARKIRTGFCER